MSIYANGVQLINEESVGGTDGDLSVRRVYQSHINRDLRWWDDGFGPLWLYRDAGGLLGVVRALSWDEAWECCEDAIFDDADPEDVAKMGDEIWEGFGYRPNGASSDRPWARTSVYQTDLNGERLERLTQELADELHIVVEVEDDN